MDNSVIVKDVIETHDCFGRKTIDITSMSEDEIVPSSFRLTKNYMIPIEKLILSTVSPHDKVIVNYDQFSLSPNIVGEYVGMKSHIDGRSPICKCGTILTTDGWELFCPNQVCSLTALARINRIANTSFFIPDLMDTTFCGIPIVGRQISIPTSADIYKERPFEVLLYPAFWGENGRTIDQIIDRKKLCISSATFLVYDLFENFLESVGTTIPTNSSVFSSLSKFFGALDEIVSRRDYESQDQNYFIKNFIWSLGIESLPFKIIEDMVSYEMALGQYDCVFAVYAHLLSDPSNMVREIGTNPAIAQAIANEFFIRQYEFFDIFSHYSEVEDLFVIFKNLENKQNKLKMRVVG